MAAKHTEEAKDGSSTTEEERYTFFWRSASPFSQWHPCKFTVNGVLYNCAEQYMMHQKAVLFKDEQMAAQILASDDPKKQKSLGRKVSNFDPDVWNSKCRDIVKDANYAKFGQNNNLYAEMEATKGTVLVEASPRDRIWGIGLGAANPKAKKKATWRGRNWLGYALTAVRDKLMEERESDKKDSSGDSDDSGEKKNKDKSEQKNKPKRKNPVEHDLSRSKAAKVVS